MQFTEVCACDKEREREVKEVWGGVKRRGREWDGDRERQVISLFTVKSGFNARQCIFIIIIHLMESNAHLLAFRLKDCSNLFKLKSGNPKYINSLYA